MLKVLWLVNDTFAFKYYCIIEPVYESQATLSLESPQNKLHIFKLLIMYFSMFHMQY